MTKLAFLKIGKLPSTSLHFNDALLPHRLWENLPKIYGPPHAGAHPRSLLTFSCLCQLLVRPPPKQPPLHRNQSRINVGTVRPRQASVLIDGDPFKVGDVFEWYNQCPGSLFDFFREVVQVYIPILHFAFNRVVIISLYVYGLFGNDTFKGQMVFYLFLFEIIFYRRTFSAINQKLSIKKIKKCRPGDILFNFHNFIHPRNSFFAIS